ncbi:MULTISPECIES: thioredoxin [Helicobacter]|uniref:Thioredoxin n=1 Tax=Helicobacter macacae MIT 99-5501 TaxID=1357400 RepID=V8CE80_9HELI|nr:MULTISPECIES: thioredoxin [Helicobacter]ETD25021.1 thioredoxin [Helicobacter macacae MIT 99-5501]RDU53532.1 thioredoxin [Helicobacter sp. MIT 01-3238]
MGKYIELKKDNFEQVTKSGVAMVDFWAPWCGPCRMLAPVIDELASDFEGKAAICKVNVDEEKAISEEYGISNIPTIFFMKDGQVVEQIVGAHSKAVLASKIEALL